MDSNNYKKYEPIFGEWTIKNLIGEGSFGKVYEIERKDFGRVYKAALKAITIPASQSEINSIMADGMDADSVSKYFFSCVEQVVEEFALMAKLKGNSHIVSYENHKVIAHDTGIGWDILIQMELLTPINLYFKDREITQKDVVRLGIDLCQALESCHRFNIIHRDIKPENIFISELGDYKLGDFGIARTVEKTTNGLSKKGTFGYMAPEVYKGESYGSSVDIYSLGLVLYRFLNKNRLPFLPPYPQPIRFSDKDNAFLKRMGGEEFEKPICAGERLSEIVLKACAYHPQDRYVSAEAMRKDLEEVLLEEFSTKQSINVTEENHVYEESDNIDNNMTVLLDDYHENDLDVGAEQEDDFGQKEAVLDNEENIVNVPQEKNNRKKIFTYVSIASIVALFICVFVLLGNKRDNNTLPVTSVATESEVDVDSISDTIEQTENIEPQKNIAAINKKTTVYSNHNENTDSVSGSNAVEELYDEKKGINTYIFIQEDVSWTEAQQACEFLGGHLARINTKEEFDAVTAEIEEKNLVDIKFWIGGARAWGQHDYYWVYGNNDYGTISINKNPELQECWMSDEPSFTDKDLGIEEDKMNLFYIKKSNRWVFNDVPDDILSVAGFYKGKIGYICEIE